MTYIAATFGSETQIPANAGTNVIASSSDYLMQPTVDYIYGNTSLIFLLFSVLAVCIVFMVGISLFSIAVSWIRSRSGLNTGIPHTGTHTMRKIRQNEHDYKILHMSRPKSFGR